MPTCVPCKLASHASLQCQPHWTLVIGRFRHNRMVNEKRIEHAEMVEFFASDNASVRIRIECPPSQGREAIGEDDL